MDFPIFLYPVMQSKNLKIHRCPLDVLEFWTWWSVDRDLFRLEIDRDQYGTINKFMTLTVVRPYGPIAVVVHDIGFLFMVSK